MTWPHERYVNYLVAVAGLADVEARHMLEREAFPSMDDADLARVRYQLDMPPGFDAFDSEHRASQTWLRTRGLLGMVRGDPAVREAFLLLRGPWRLPAEVLLLSGMAPSGVSEFLSKSRCGTPSGATAERFASLFFGVNEMDDGDLAAFLKVAPAGDVYARVLGKSADEALTLAKALVGRRAQLVLVTGGPRYPGQTGMPV